MKREEERNEARDAEAVLGINYGLLGDNLPAPKDVIKLIREKGIKGVRIFEPNHEVLEALRGNDIIVSVGVKNGDLVNLAQSREAADNWIQENYVPYYKDVFIDYITVGNEVIPGPYAQYVFPAIRNLDASFRAAGLYENIKITTVVPTNVLGTSYPPSSGAFSNESASFMSDIIKYLTSEVSPIMVNVYPYFALVSDPTKISLDYALFQSPTPIFMDQGLAYYNLYDAMLDAFLAAAYRVTGGKDVAIVVSETGWPSAGNPTYATIDNARIYNNNLKKAFRKGTPRTPGLARDTFIFAMFNEDLKPQGVEQNFGSFYPNMKPVYPLW
ncbi:hypothetical protein IFM89_011654 [Coptis chinensis]|uniref:Glucan endo-1,3-beta-D-glucosidase n=1 Tax=Coptis chinensis TaxID=261450 RepID=A0A835LZB1_9MAGN|nr:hypothetical protein IFM89_011654 [Coptis chinensis]